MRGLAILLLAFHAVPVLSLIDHFYGVYFGYRDITVVHLGQYDNIIPVAKIEGSKEYQARMRELSINSTQRRLQGDLYDNVWCLEDQSLAPGRCDPPKELRQDQGIFNATLSQILETIADLGHPSPINISAITVPSDIEKIERKHLRRTFEESPLVPGIGRWSRITGSRDAAKYAYDLDLLGGWICRPCQTNIVVFIDHGYDYLNITVADVDMMHSIDIIDEHSKQLELSGSMDVQQIAVHDALENFIAEFQSDSELSEHLHAIVIMGEAPATPMGLMKLSLRRLLPCRWQGLLRHQIDPNFVMATGGAKKRRFWEHEVYEEMDIDICSYSGISIWDYRRLQATERLLIQS